MDRSKNCFSKSQNIRIDNKTLWTSSKITDTSMYLFGKFLDFCENSETLV